MSIKNFVHFVVVVALLASVLSACSTATPTPVGTSTPTNTPTPKATGTITLTPTVTLRPTSTETNTPLPNLTATKQYSDFSEKLQGLYDAGYINTTKGTYKYLGYYPMSVAKINWFTWEYIDDEPENFVINSDISWDSASAAADNSGCGYVFHLEDGEHFYIFYVSLKGFVTLNARNAGRWVRFGNGTFGNAKQTGKVNVSLIAQEDVIKVVVDDKLIKTYQGFKDKFLLGQFGYTVLSGTNKSYGTRCVFENTVLWKLP